MTAAAPVPRPEAAGAPVRRPALVDVARVAGVSAQTVSRVVNGHPHVSASTRASVQQAITELGYRRNLSAHMLATGRSTVVGVMVGSSSAYGPTAMTRALLSAAERAGLTAIPEHVRPSDTDDVRATADRLLDHGALGLLLALPSDAALRAVAPVVPRGTPVISVGDAVVPHVPHVSVDQYSGAREATEHLLAAGHPTVFHVAGPAEWKDAEERERGWRDALAAVGLEPPPVLRGDWSAASGHEAGRLLAKIRGCSAVFSANDQMALGVASAMAGAGRRIPEDVGLVGFDDLPESPYFPPPLTTVHQDFDAVAAAALDLLHHLVVEPDSRPEDVVVPALLVVRGSTVTSSAQAQHTWPGAPRPA